ncbi:MAG: hypothetical protein U9O55_00005, partial [Patescibacteria group bacterium]|nr:hypothetical protein [Patescibacteria group bacterium]
KHIIKILTGKQPENFYEKWSTLKRILFIRVYSPVDFMVVAPNNDKVGKDFLNNKIVNEIEGAFYSGFNKEAEFVTIINPEKGDYEIKLQGIDNGSYKLGIDILNDNNLKETKENLISGIISLGKEEIFTFNYIENNNEQNIIIEKKVSFNSIIQDIEELYQNKEIKKSFIKKSLKRQFKNLERKYNKIEKIKKSYHKKILKKYIQKSLNFAKRKLKFYLKQNWITQTAYDILINDIDNLIIKIK